MGKLQYIYFSMLNTLVQALYQIQIQLAINHVNCYFYAFRLKDLNKARINMYVHLLHELT